MRIWKRVPFVPFTTLRYSTKRGFAVGVPWTPLNVRAGKRRKVVRQRRDSRGRFK